ncbi:MAG: TolC family protein [Planctomycetota bacterium]
MHVRIDVPSETGGAIVPEALELLKRELTEDDAVKIAILNNREVSAALARLGVSSSELVQAGLLRNPVFSASATLFDSGTEIEASVMQPFLDLFFLSARKRVAEAELEANRAQIANEIIRLAYDARRAFVRVHAAVRLLQVERDVLRAAQASFDLMSQLHRAGNVTDPRLTTEEIALARAKLGVAQAESALLEAREPLNVLLGLWGDSVTWTLAGTLTEDPGASLDVEQVETRAIAASLDLAESRAHTTAEARRAGFTSWEAAFSTGDVGLAAKREVDGGDWGLGPALAVSVPLFDTGAAARAGAHARVQASLAHHVALAVEIRSAARRLRARALSLGEQAAFIRTEELPTASRLVRETLRNYNAMQIGVFDVLVVKEQEIAAQRSHVETLRDAVLARLDLDELLAGSFNQERVGAEPRARRNATMALPAGGH